MDIRLVVLVCLAFANVNAEKGRRPPASKAPLTLEQELTNFMKGYAEIIVSSSLDGIRDSWTEDGELVITVHGQRPFYGNMELVDHFDTVFQGVVIRKYDVDMTAYGTIDGTNDDVVWATVAQLVYGEEKEGGVYDPNPIANLTAQFIFKRNICDDGFRIKTQGCNVNFVTEWFAKYLA